MVFSTWPLPVGIAEPDGTVAMMHRVRVKGVRYSLEPADHFCRRLARVKASHGVV
jgi:hypothetical protein